MRIVDRVSNILSVSRAARNSDRELLIIFMQKMGMELTDRQIDIFRKMPSTETIRRTRQSLQERGLYPADQKVNEARYNKFKEMRGAAGITDPEKILENQGYRVRPWGE